MDGRRPGFNMFQPCSDISHWSGSRWGSARVKSAILSLGWLMAVLFFNSSPPPSQAFGTRMLQNAFAHGGQMWATIRQSPFMTEHLDCNVPAESTFVRFCSGYKPATAISVGRWPHLAGSPCILQWFRHPIFQKFLPLPEHNPKKYVANQTDCPEWSDRPRPKIPHSKSHCTSLPGKLRSCTFAVGISCSESLPKRMFSPQRADPSIRNSCRRRVPKVPKFTCRHKSLKGSKLS